jgi:hypothetical protein
MSLLVATHFSWGLFYMNASIDPGEGVFGGSSALDID